MDPVPVPDETAAPPPPSPKPGFFGELVADVEGLFEDAKAVITPPATPPTAMEKSIDAIADAQLALFLGAFSGIEDAFPGVVVHFNAAINNGIDAFTGLLSGATRQKPLIAPTPSPAIPAPATGAVLIPPTGDAP